jgi:hypothetical protein
MNTLTKITSILSSAKILIAYIKAITALLDKVVEPIDEFSDNIRKLKNDGVDQ